MEPNPILKKLGFDSRDRLVIIHADDVGMCQASLAAYADLVDSGLVSAASVMVPCPWFPATAAFCRDHAGDNVDMGVHITLTSEFADYRWGPVSTRDPATGLMDKAGYFHATREGVWRNAEPNAVEEEIGAQVERALNAGIDVTHIDTHMGAVGRPEFAVAYLQVALRHGIPPFLPRTAEAQLRERGVDAESTSMIARQLQVFEAQGLPLLDDIQAMPLEEPEDRVAQVKQVLADLPAGVTYLVGHPAKDTPELRAITADWRGRVADYEAFTSASVAGYIRDSGIHVIGWRVLRDLMRTEYTAG
jgi:predicted glycoside hydrolase/deacetylase ChbG (UPF0249 family)